MSDIEDFKAILEETIDPDGVRQIAATLFEEVRLLKELNSRLMTPNKVKDVFRETLEEWATLKTANVSLREDNKTLREANEEFHKTQLVHGAAAELPIEDREKLHRLCEHFPIDEHLEGRIRHMKEILRGSFAEE